jgi:predicted dithiol-disulfide oxidoreductase (DUF899 family)
MTYADVMTTLEAKRERIIALHGELSALQATVEPQVVENYLLQGWDGPVRLSELFGDKDDLILIHNMGAGCSSCSMWADGFNGVYDHLASRAAFVVASPDPIDAQRKLAARRGWRFPMVCYAESPLAQDLGYRDLAGGNHGGWDAGVSVFHRNEGRILRVSDAQFAEFDDFCVVYHLFDLFPDADRNWQPSFSYVQEAAQ